MEERRARGGQPLQPAEAQAGAQPHRQGLPAGALPLLSLQTRRGHWAALNPHGRNSAFIMSCKSSVRWPPHTPIKPAPHPPQPSRGSGGSTRSKHCSHRGLDASTGFKCGFAGESGRCYNNIYPTGEDRVWAGRPLGEEGFLEEAAFTLSPDSWLTVRPQCGKSPPPGQDTAQARARWQEVTKAGRSSSGQRLAPGKHQGGKCYLPNCHKGQETAVPPGGTSSVTRDGPSPAPTPAKASEPHPTLR